MNRIHHIGIIVPDEEQADFLLQLIGMARGHSVYVEEYQANCIFAGSLEFIVPVEGSKLAQFNKGRGGLHHIAVETPDIKQTMNRINQEFEVDFLEPEPVIAGDLLINFLPPAMTRGITVEFVQKK